VNAGDFDALGARRADSLSFGALDLLATMVAIVDPHGHCVFVNAAFEEFLGLSRRSVLRGSVFDWIVEPQVFRETIAAVSRNDFSTSRLEALLRRQGAKPTETFPVHVIVNRMEGSDDVVVELVEVEQQTRQAREERALEQAQATKELIRNLAHEIKNPLGGIRGAAQLLEMEVESRALTEYTQVIINEADRLQGLVDRLLAPHRKPHVVGDVNIHEVCERVRALILAEFPRGLKTERDYDISIPDFRGDREQLIQAVLNIAKNAAQALESRIEAGDARIMLRTRINRQITLGKHRYRLALELHIEDNGPGVPETLRDRIFFPLVSGREGGSGLGLTLARTFVQQHQGTVECESEPGKTIFKILIPLR
jgi:two-component system nitrogen regulation sensor histidine kinase GlnL